LVKNKNVYLKENGEYNYISLYDFNENNILTKVKYKNINNNIIIYSNEQFYKKVN